MKILLKLLVTSLAVYFSASLLKGVYLDGFPTAIMVAILIGFLNAFLKPILVLLTIPLTLISFGLFLVVINAVIIVLADYALDGFRVDSFLTAMIFSILVSVTTWILDAIAKPKEKRAE